MPNTQLEAFLAEEARGSAPAAPEQPQAAPEPQQTLPESPPQQATPDKPEAAQKPSETPQKPEEDDEPDIVDQNGLVPRQELDRERTRRRDWKEKFARADGELAALKRQLEEAKKAPAPPAPPPQQPMFVPPPDPNHDPAGFVQHMVVQNQKAMLNERLNTSEAMARERLGDEKLDAYVSDFKAAAESDPSLWGKLYSQPHPYGWLTRQMDTWRMHKEIGDNPDAYRQRIVAEERAKWEQEVASSRGAPVSPAANLPPSLANVRSVAGRTAPAWTGEPSLEDVLAPVQNRKRTNGAGPVRY